MWSDQSRRQRHRHLAYDAARHIMPGVVWALLYWRYGFVAAEIASVTCTSSCSPCWVSSWRCDKNQRPASRGPSDIAWQGRGTRTHDPRFWRPMLYQLSYTPSGDAVSTGKAGIAQDPVAS